MKGGNIMVYDLHRIFLQVTRHVGVMPSISLTRLSNNLGVERHTIAKAIKNATGLSFREFRNSVLLKHACGLLKDESNRTIKEVAFAVGYQSQGSLSRFIRIATGHSAKAVKTGKLEDKAS
jgi:AraC-like DNA-binding protein